MRLNTWRYRLTRDPQEALRQRLRELAARARAVWLSAIDGAVEARRLARQCEADLSALWPRGPRGADEAAEEAGQSRARAAAAADAAE